MNEERKKDKIYYTEDYDWDNACLDEKFAEEVEEVFTVRMRRIGPVGKIIILVLLLAFTAFSFPNLSFLLSDQFSFLRQNQALKNDEIVLSSKAAVVSIEATPLSGLSGKVKRGSGFNILQDGLVMTNNHVVADSREIKISFSSGQTFISQNIKQIDKLDIALVDFNGCDLPALAIEGDTFIKSGEVVTIIGNPMGFQRISARGKVGQYCRLSEDSFVYFDIAADIKPGSSGSPVINEDGKVVGIVFATAQLTNNGEKEKHALAIPLKGLKNLIFQIPQE